MRLAQPVLRTLLAAVAILAPLPPAIALRPTVDAPAQRAQARLRAQFARFAATTDGTVGIAVQRLGRGDAPVVLNGDTLFPMASTFKVAIAGAVLARVDRGALALDTMVPVQPADIVTSDGIAALARRPGTALSVRDLLELMLTRSDNMAADLLLRQAGGPQAVTGWLRGLGIREQRVDGSVAQMLYRAMGIMPERLAKGGSYRQIVDAALRDDPDLRLREARDLPNIAFANDARDTSTPVAMLQLLGRIVQGQALSPASTAHLLAIMARCRTGANRLKAMLPPDTPIAHKTGTLNGTGNDVGVVRLPDGGLFAIAVFVMKDGKGHAVRDRIMADAARAAYDYYLFTRS